MVSRGSAFLIEKVVAERDATLTDEELAIDAQYVALLERQGEAAIEEQIELHTRRGACWCAAPRCADKWPCKWVQRAWKAHRQLARGLTVVAGTGAER